MTALVYRDGRIDQVDTVDPAWLTPTATEVLWVDIEDPGEADRRLLSDVFRFHELAVEDAVSPSHHPKIEPYDQFLYLILHGMMAGKKHEGFETHDIDFFLGRNFLVTVHVNPSRSISEERAILLRHASLMAEGPGSLLHRIVDRLVDHYSPEVDVLEDRLEQLEKKVFAPKRTNPLRDILGLK